MTEDRLEENTKIIVARKPAPLRFCQDCTRTSARAWLIALSYTFSISIFMIAILINYVQDDDNSLAIVNGSNQGEPSTAHPATTALANSSALASASPAAGTLIMTLTNAVNFTFFSCLFSKGIILSEKLGEIISLQKRLTESAESHHIQLQIASIRQEISASNYAGIASALILSPAPFFILFYAGPMLKAAGQSEAVYQTVNDFLSIYACSVPALYIRIASEQILFAFKKEAIATAVAIPWFLVSTGLAVCLGFGYGFPKMGVPGISIGYTAGSYLTAITYMGLLAKVVPAYQFWRIGEAKQHILPFIKSIFKRGWSIALSFLNESSVSITLTILAAKLGETALADLNSDVSVFFFSLVFSAAFGQVNYINLSHLVGEKNYPAIVERARNDMITTSTWMGLICVTASGILRFTETYPSDLADILQIIFTPAVFLDTIRYSLLAQQRSIKDDIISTCISSGGLWGGLILSGLLMLKPDADVTLLAAGYLAGEVVAVSGIGLARRRPLMRKQSLEKRLETDDESCKDKCSRWCCFRFGSKKRRAVATRSTTPSPVNAI